MIITQDLYDRWITNRLVNPKTGKRIDPNARRGVYAEFVKYAKQHDWDLKELEYTDTNDIVDLSDCKNTTDPVSYDDLTQLSSKDVLKLGSVDNVHCYTIETMFNYYKSSLTTKIPMKDPINPSYKLTDTDIKHLIRKIKCKYPQWTIPRNRRSKRRTTYLIYHEDSYESELTKFNLVNGTSFERLSFYHLSILDLALSCEIDLGMIPAFVEGDFADATNTTSATVLQSIYSLWNEQRLMETLRCSLYRTFEYWIDEEMNFNRKGFNDLAYEIEQLI